MVTPQDLSTDSQVRTSLRDSFFYPGSERVKGKINLKKKKATRPLACPGEIKSLYLAAEVTSRHIRVNR